MRSTKIIKICSSSLCTCLHHIVILGTRNKITDFFMILAWASPFNVKKAKPFLCNCILYHEFAHVLVQCWPIVCDAGPTLNQHMGNVPCLLGSHRFQSQLSKLDTLAQCFFNVSPASQTMFHQCVMLAGIVSSIQQTIYSGSMLHRRATF